MKLIGPPEFARRYFAEGCAPDLRTIRSWVEKGIVPGRILDTGARKQVFIDAEAWEGTPMTGNALADRVLEKALARARTASGAR